MTRHVPSPLQAEPLIIGLSDLSAELPDLAQSSTGSKLFLVIYWLSVAAFCFGMLAGGAAEWIGPGADALGWLGVYLTYGGFGGFGLLLTSGAIVFAWRLSRASKLLLRRLDEVHDLESNLIARLSHHDADDLSERGRFAKVHAQLVERTAVAASIGGVAATQAKPLIDAWHASGVLPELHRTFENFPAASALGLCLGAFLLVDHARKLTRLARLYEEAATRAAKALEGPGTVSL